MRPFKRAVDDEIEAIKRGNWETIYII